MGNNQLRSVIPRSLAGVAGQRAVRSALLYMVACLLINISVVLQKHTVSTVYSGAWAASLQLS